MLVWCTPPCTPGEDGRTSVRIEERELEAGGLN